MSQFKFTTDGKKVITVGKLNAQETIVQEVFVSESGAEIPSGENFVVKSLHEEPVKSWKEKNLEDLEKRYDSVRRDLESKIQEVSKRIRLEQDKCAQFVKSLSVAREKTNEDLLQKVSDILAGKYTHAVVDKTYNQPKIMTLEQALVARDEHRGILRALSLSIPLFSFSEDKITINRNSYSDGSGSWSPVDFFYSEQDAANFVADILNKKEVYSKEDIEFFHKYGINPDANILERTVSDAKERAQKRTEEIEKYRETENGKVDSTLKYWLSLTSK